MLWSCDYWTALEVWSVCQKNQWILGLYNSWGNIQLLFKISCPHLKSWNSCIIRGLQRRLYLWLILAEAGEVVYVIIHMVCVIPCGLKMLRGTCVSWTVLGRMLLKKKKPRQPDVRFFSFRINLAIAIKLSHSWKKGVSLIPAPFCYPSSSQSPGCERDDQAAAGAAPHRAGAESLRSELRGRRHRQLRDPDPCAAGIWAFWCCCWAPAGMRNGCARPWRGTWLCILQ